MLSSTPLTTPAPAMADSTSCLTTPKSDSQISVSAIVTVSTKPAPLSSPTRHVFLNDGVTSPVGSFIYQPMAAVPSQVSLSPNYSHVRPLFDCPPRTPKTFRSNDPPSISDIVDLTHLPDSPVPPCFEVQVGDIILYFPGVCGNMFNLEWSIVYSASQEDGVVLEGFSFIGVDTGVQVLRPCPTNILKPTFKGFKRFH